MAALEGPGKRLRWLRRALRPLRRGAAWFALVDEERNTRVAQWESWMAVGRSADDPTTLMERVDLVVQELWRRAEGADARAATEIQRLTAAVGQVGRENAALLRRLDGGAGSGLRYDGGEGVETVQVPPPKVTMRMLFDEVERGSREEVVAKLARYGGYFLGLEPAVDLGCGQGEFLEVLATAGVKASGIDLMPDSVAACRERGLDVQQADLFEFLASLEPGSVGGFFSGQVVEHLPPERLPEMLEGVERALRPGGVCIVETPNPATFATHVQSFWRDPTHTRPVPAPALSFVARCAGLVVENVIYGSPSPEGERLKPVDAETLIGAGEAEQALASAFNDAVGQLNELLYGYQDYALVLRKPEAPTA